MSAWARRMTGLAGLELLNHSGLSAASRASPRSLTAFGAADQRFFADEVGEPLTLFDLLRRYKIEGGWPMTPWCAPRPAR